MRESIYVVCITRSSVNINNYKIARLFCTYYVVKKKKKVLVSLAQLVRTIHNICKVRGSNPDHHQKKYNKKYIY